MYNSKLGKHPGKLKLRYVGPYKIFKDLGQGTFQLAHLENNLLAKPVNGFRLKLFLTNDFQGVDLNLVGVDEIGRAHV